MGLLFAFAAVMMVACSGPSRVASTPVQVPGQESGGDTVDTGEQSPGQATDAPSQVETMKAGDFFATMTAAAVEPAPQTGETQVPQQEATTAPQVAEPTSVSPTATPKPPKPTSQPTVDCSSPYTVQKGDWVWDIGRQCNIDPNSIIAVNGLAYPYVIYPGDVLILPANAPPFPGP